MSSPIPEIDADELEAAIRFVESIADMDRAEFGPSDWERAKLTAAAARAHLATLPRWKEVEFVRHLVVTRRTEYGPFLDEEDAIGVARGHQDATIVRLTGKAKVRA